MSQIPPRRWCRCPNRYAVIRGTKILSRGGPKGRLENFRRTWWCLVLTEAVVQEVFDLSPRGRE